MIRASLKEKKALSIIRAEMDVRLNAMGLKIRRLENDRNFQRGKIIRLENEIKDLKQKLNNKEK